MKLKNLITLGLASIIAFSVGTTAFADATNYTYNYDFWNEEVQSPDAYYVNNYLMGVDLGISNFKDPQGLFIRDNRIYVCDSGNNRIVIINYDASADKYTVSDIIESVVIDGEDSPFSYPTDIFAAKNGMIYIADNKNHRILMLDSEFNYKNTVNKPNDSSIGESTEFLPNKLVVDDAHRMYVQATNINKGLLEFDREGDFVGYVGANKVDVNPVDKLWKKFATDAQRAQMELFVPTEYSNVFLDYDGFIYTVTNTFNEGRIRQADPVRRLNSLGTDILIRNAANVTGKTPPIGDERWNNIAGISGASRFVDVCAFSSDSYACFDRTRGRIFMYDFQGHLLYAFGGLGNKQGYFSSPAAIESMDYDLFALDAKTGAITRFNLTDYGYYIKEAMNFYKSGKYDLSAEMWDEVLKLNGNYDLAYIGKGRAALRQGDYQAAMKYYKTKNDAENYGKAFTLYRKQWMEEHLVTIIIIIISAYVLYKGTRAVLKFRKELKQG